MHTNVLIISTEAIDSFPPTALLCLGRYIIFFASPTAQCVPSERPQPVFPDAASVRLADSTCHTT